MRNFRLINIEYGEVQLANNNTFFENPDKLIKNALKRIFKQHLKAGQIDPDLWRYNYNALLKAAENGMKRDFGKIKFGTPDWEFTQNLKYNLAVFAAFKNHNETTTIALLLTDRKGNVRPWKEFRDEALKISEKYNKAWLRAEYNRAHSSAQAAKNWQRYVSRKKLYPNLRYIATKDERTRDDHMKLDGAIYPIDHTFWDSYYPPNDWGCRCRVEQTDLEPTARNGIDLKPDFRNNPGKTARVFTPDHPYIRNTKPELKQKIKAFVEQNIRSSKDVAAAWNRYNAYSDEWIKEKFDTSTGGYIVRHRLHNSQKDILKKELDISDHLMRQGYKIELTDESSKIKTYDALINNIRVEYKTIKGFSNIRRYALQASEKKAEVLLLHLKKKPNRDFYRYIIEVLTKNKYKPVREVWWIDTKGMVHKKTPR